MMKFAFFVLLFFIYYIAGVYESRALMVLFLAQLLLIPVMFGISVILKRKLTVSFKEKLIIAGKGEKFQWTLRAENKGILPVSRFQMKYTAASPGQNKEKQKKIYAGSERGVCLYALTDRMEHCGIGVFQAKKLKVYDYLSLFSRKRKLQDCMEVAVFPKEYALQIEITGTTGESIIQREGAESCFSGSSGEIRQIREYRQTDSVRHIHWNQTARTGKVWIKEYQKEKTGIVRLFLEAGDRKERSPKDMDAYYTLLYGTLLGLLKAGVFVQVFRNGNEDTEPWMMVQNRQQCMELLLRLYRSEEYHQEKYGNGTGCYAGKTIRLTKDLIWMADNKEIRRFSRENLEEELLCSRFII